MTVPVVRPRRPRHKRTGADTVGVGNELATAQALDGRGNSYMLSRLTEQVFKKRR